MDRGHTLLGCLAFLIIASMLAFASLCQVTDSIVADAAAEDATLKPAKPSTNTRTVTIPVWETKTRTISYKVTRPVWEQRSRTMTYQVMKPVSEQRTRVDPETGEATQYTVTRFVPQQEEKVVNYKVCKMVPEQKQKTVTYKVCRMEKVERPIGSE